MSTENPSKILNRYTALPVLLDILRRKMLVLNNPSLWGDENDVEVLSEYKRRKGLGSLFAICFCGANETNLCWSAYADGVSGCCIEFDREKLLQSFPENKAYSGGRFRHRTVDYKPIWEAEAEKYPDDDFPFIKRRPYRGEEEYRILWECNAKKDTIEVPISLKSIRRITLNQQMPEGVFKTTKDLKRSERNRKQKFTDQHCIEMSGGSKHSGRCSHSRPDFGSLFQSHRPSPTRRIPPPSSP